MMRPLWDLSSYQRLFDRSIASMSGNRIVDPAIIFRPLFVPRAYPIGHPIILSRFLADPKDSRYDVPFPRETLSQLGRFSRQLTWCERE